MKIAYVDFICDESDFFEDIVTEMRKYAQEGTTIDYHYVVGVNNLEYRSYEALVIPALISKVGELRDAGYDAAIIGCFLDPGVDILKEVYHDIIITGPGESALDLGGKLCRKMSVIAPKSRMYEDYNHFLSKNGKSAWVPRVRYLEMAVIEMFNDPALMESRMIEEISAAINEDGAECIVLGCTMETGQFKRLQEQFDVPVIDPTIAALMNCEHLYMAKKVCGWRVSDHGHYETPPKKEFDIFLRNVRTAGS